MDENNRNDDMENSNVFSDETGSVSDENVVNSENIVNSENVVNSENAVNSENIVNSENVVNSESSANGENANENISYTSEYGNTVSGNQASSVYSYSYMDNKNSATSSGDYHAEGTFAQGTQGQSANYTNENTTGYNNQYANAATGQNMDNSNQYGGSGYVNNNYGGNNYNADNNYNNNFNQDNGNAGRDKVGQKRSKKPMSFGKKLAVCVVLAVIFGVVAGVCFQGINHIASNNSGRLQKSGTEEIKLGGQADTVGTTSVATGTAVGVMTDVSGIVEQTMPTIVAITSTFDGASYSDLFGRYYQDQETTSCGSGFIVGKNKTELLIATNNHVVNGKKNAKTISVQFIDDEVCEASIKGTDSSNDLAVIAVKLNNIKKSTMEKIKIADLGNSDDLKVGEMVVAIGNALGYGQSVTVGYVSAKDRDMEETSETDGTVNKIKAIQTDAAINPGNSGGALMNISGQVIGINSAKIAASTVEGVGYAIPISQAIPIIENLKSKEKLSDKEKGYLGIKGMTVSDELSAYNMPNGVYVSEISDGGAAAKGGVLVGDIITSIEDMEVRTIQSLVEKANSYRKGTKVKITLQRSNNGVYEEKKVTVTLQGEESLEGLSDDDSSNNSNNNYGNNGNGNYGNDGDGNNDGDYGNGGNNGNGNDENGDYGSWFDDFLNPFGN